jgi:hypothetical protein
MDKPTIVFVMCELILVFCLVLGSINCLTRSVLIHNVLPTSSIQVGMDINRTVGHAWVEYGNNKTFMKWGDYPVEYPCSYVQSHIKNSSGIRCAE